MNASWGNNHNNNSFNDKINNENGYLKNEIIRFLLLRNFQKKMN